MDLELDDHVVVITGGARGLGEAMCRAFVDNGAHVVVWDRDDAASELAEKLDGVDGRASAIVADVTDPAAVGRAVDEVAAGHARIDALINCAGFSRDAPVADMTDEEWHSVIDVCLTGTFHVTRAIVPHMLERSYGRIINVSSRARFGDVNKVNYCAAKAGVDGFTRALALELGKDGVTANAIAPGYCETERARNNRFAADIKARALDRTPTARLGTPDDVADAALYLASPRTGFLTGEVLTISGGRWR